MGTAAETVPNSGKPGIFLMFTFETILVPLSLISAFKCRCCSEYLPRHQPLKPMVVAVLNFKITRVIVPIVHLVILLSNNPSATITSYWLHKCAICTFKCSVDNHVTIMYQYLYIYFCLINQCFYI